MNRQINRLLKLLLIAVLAVSLWGIARQQQQYQSGEQAYSEAEELAGLKPAAEIIKEAVIIEKPKAISPTETAKQTAPPSLTIEEQTASIMQVNELTEQLPAEEEAPEDTEQPEETDLPEETELPEIDLAALRNINSEVIGWIEIPDTVISYPLLQGEDNEYYLKHTWQRERNSVGAIFLECQNSPDFEDFNTIIYGHKMRNDSMFSGLHYYKEQSYFEENPIVLITADDGIRQYEIFAAFEAGVKEITYALALQNEAEKEEFISFSLSQSVIEADIIPTAEDSILTLSTCTGNGHAKRWVVQAVLSEMKPF